MALKIRFLLTSRCTATCAYCHNEGQDKHGASLLSVEVITHILNTLQAHECVPDEIILSGGEPTLHKQVGMIAQRCKATGAYLSMDSHGGHPVLLQAALPYLDELKLHIDSFNAVEQYDSMGIDIQKVLSSIHLAQQFPLALRINHPLKCATRTAALVTEARNLGVDCKIIEVFGMGTPEHALNAMDWQQHHYTKIAAGQWLHANGKHRLFTKRCGTKYNSVQDTLFIGADGIRRALDGMMISRAEDFSHRLLKTQKAITLRPQIC